MDFAPHHGAKGLPERIVAGGLVIRGWSPDDLQARYAAVVESYDHLHPWMEWLSEPPTLERQRRWGEQQSDPGRSTSERSYGIFDAREGTLLGVVGAHDRLGPAVLEIGYWCHVAHTGKGVITRAADALTRAALALDGVERVEIRCDRANSRSAAVARRLGYRLDRIENDGIYAPAECGQSLVWTRDRDSRLPWTDCSDTRP
ncbi:MAG: GNAT family N-acetyltransferase [Mycobacteriaceae bacterium]|nr:GNAT family N-acetyltransferase [Mycobacteriaceae bacterium]